MKILLFTHEQDIDGMGSIILGKHAFSDFDYITCKTFEINEKVNNTIKDGSIYNYDYIYVTDLCITEPLLSYINDDYRLNNKLIILDHHKTEIEEGNDKYSFVNIIVENEKGKQSGTSLFYEYLINNNLLQPNECLDEFVELTRQYDTWEWKKNENVKARKLHIIFEQIGFENYIQSIFSITENSSEFEFTKEQYKSIDDFEEKLKKDTSEILKNMIVHTISIENESYKIGFVITPYKYRNDLDEIVSKNNINDIDLIGMIITDKDTVSYRKVKDIDVSKVAVYFGGKGHKGAASSPKDNEKFELILKKLDSME